MSAQPSLFSRALITAGAAATLAVGALIGSAPASAHVHVDADDPVRGDSAVLTFRVPNESDTGSPTTELSVNLPNLTSVSTATMPGWTAKLDRDAAAGTVRSVTWTAAPNSGIGADQFGQFVLRVKLPDTATVSFPATQTYADGTVVHWDQPTPPGGAEPEHPSPELTLTAAGSDPEQHEHAAGPAGAPEAPATPEPAATEHHSTSGPDNTARALAGVALLVGGLGIGIGLARRRA